MTSARQTWIRCTLAAMVLLLVIATAACGPKSETADTATVPEQGSTPDGGAGADEKAAEAPSQGTDGKEEAKGHPAATPAPSAPKNGSGKSSPSPTGAGTPAGSTGGYPEKPAAPPRPVYTMVQVPQGKNITVTLDQPLSSKTGRPGDPFTATVKKDVQTRAHPEVIIPIGSVVSGQIVEAQTAKQMKGQAKLVVKFDELKLPSGETMRIVASLGAEGKDTTKRSVGGIAGGAAAGAILGRVIGKDTKGAAIGAVAGAAIGTGVVLGMDNKDIELPVGTELVLNVDEAFEVPVAKPNA